MRVAFKFVAIGVMSLGAITLGGTVIILRLLYSPRDPLDFVFWNAKSTRVNKKHGSPRARVHERGNIRSNAINGTPLSGRELTGMNAHLDKKGHDVKAIACDDGLFVMFNSTSAIAYESTADLTFDLGRFRELYSMNDPHLIASPPDSYDFYLINWRSGNAESATHAAQLPLNPQTEWIKLTTSSIFATALDEDGMQEYDLETLKLANTHSLNDIYGTDGPLLICSTGFDLLVYDKRLKSRVHCVGIYHNITDADTAYCYPYIVAPAFDDENKIALFDIRMAARIVCEIDCYPETYALCNGVIAYTGTSSESARSCFRLYWFAEQSPACRLHILPAAARIVFLTRMPILHLGKKYDTLRCSSGRRCPSSLSMLHPLQQIVALLVSILT